MILNNEYKRWMICKQCLEIMFKPNKVVGVIETIEENKIGDWFNPGSDKSKHRYKKLCGNCFYTFEHEILGYVRD